MSDQPDLRDTDTPDAPGRPADPERVVVRDKRRIDPQTGAPREAAAPADGR